MRKPGVFLISVALLAIGCGSSGAPGGGDVTPTCLDDGGDETSTCAVTPKGDVCEKGNASSCVTLTKVEVQDDAKEGSSPTPASS